MPHLVLAQRIAKGMMFAYPDSIPDLDGMIRLWAHETMRCVADSLTSCRQVRRLIEVCSSLYFFPFQSNARNCTDLNENMGSALLHQNICDSMNA